jgi:UDP-N-acetylglucosamine--dolichyl-phosphate N-acetylglucosaminephosphotransferase
MPGWFKPVALIFAGIPIIILGAHGDHLNLIFGDAFIPILYLPLILAIIPIAGNTINSIDVLNGAATGFIIITALPLLLSVAIFGDNNILLAGLPMLFGTIAIYMFHKFPSKIFPGDSGTLLLGAMYGALAIAGNSEIVEHRNLKSRPTVLTDDFKIKASKEKTAPSTLVRLLVAKGPLSEAEIVNRIFILAIFSSVLAFVSIIMQYYFTMW